MQDKVDATGIGSQIAANLTTAFGAQIDGEFLASVLSEILQFLQDHTWLGRHDSVGLIKS